MTVCTSSPSIYDAVLQRKEYLETLVENKQRQLVSAPPGTLRISRRRGKPRYYHRKTSTSRTGEYLRSADSDMVHLLAQKDYDQRTCAAAEAELTAANRFLTDCPHVLAEDIYRQLPEYRRSLVEPICKPDDEFITDWLNKPFTGKGFADEAPELITDKGERVRSKSEVIIANLLYKENLPYKYECPLALGRAGVVYPDFTILNVRLRREIYWEHMGMMDDPDYMNSAYKKEASYYLAGHFPGKDLILTHETRDSSLNIHLIKLMIEQYLL